MRIAVVGARAERLCSEAGWSVSTFRRLSEVSEPQWELLALTPGNSCAPPAAGLCAHSLLLPGDTPQQLLRCVSARQLIGYGLSPRDTLTLSSLIGSHRLLCVQRSFLTPGGELIEPMELPLPPGLESFSNEEALLLAGMGLLSR